VLDQGGSLPHASNHILKFHALTTVRRQANTKQFWLSSTIPFRVENRPLQAVLMALEMRDATRALTETWRRWGHDIGFGIGIAHGFAIRGTIGFEGRFDYAAIGTVSNVASRLCDEAKPGQVLISPRVLTRVENAVTVEPVGGFTLKGIRRPMLAYNVLASSPSKAN
jgi:adenylate cyclase